MKITEKKLRQIIREACDLGNTSPKDVPLQMQLSANDTSTHVPVPADYDAVRAVLDQEVEMVDLAIDIVMKSAGASCERSTAQAIIDHLKDMLVGTTVPEAPAARISGFIKGPGF